MISRKIRFCSSLLLTNALLASPFLLSATSCSHSKKESTIYFNDSPIQTTEHEFVIPFLCSACVSGYVNVDFTSGSDVNYLSIKNHVVLLENQKGNIYFTIDPSINESTSFHFGLEIKFLSYGDIEVVEKYLDFFVYFSDTPIIDTDTVELRSRAVTSTDVHQFVFDLIFSAFPAGSQPMVNVAIEDDKVGYLSLQQDSYPIIEDGGIIQSHIVINLDMEVHESQTFPFNFRINFTNSYGFSQTEIINNCSAIFEFTRRKEVPYDYFDITSESDKVILNGLKPGVSDTEAGHYTILDIPDNITDIAPQAFVSDWFCNINKIVVPKSVVKINEQAFAGCVNITDLDLSAYESNTIPWLIGSQNLFNQINNIAGYVWTSNQSTSYISSIQNALSRLGLLDDWGVFNVQSIVPTDFYDFANEENKVLTGIKEDKLSELENFKIIKIPDSVTEISTGVFEPLTYRPYKLVYDDGTVEFQTRRLIMSENIETLPTELFRYCGIAGPIIMHCPHLEIIPSSCFEFASWYGQPRLADIVEEKTLLIIRNCSSLHIIDSYAFNGVKIEQPTLQFPNSLYDLGSFCFASSLFTHISFTSSILNVGTHIYANTFYWPATPTILEIDLSCFNKIIHEESESYIPDWFYDYNFMFLSACNVTGTIKLSQKIADEIGAEKIESWKADFKRNLSIPDNWHFSFC